MPDVTLNDKRLRALIKAFSGKIPKAKVGVLSAKNNRTGKSKGNAPTNAEIGLKHEFGKEGMPMRSFLRMPISTYLQKYLEKNGAFDEEVLKLVIQEKSILQWVKKVAITAEQTVTEAFDTHGFGTWKRSNMAKKKVLLTLVETTQLRNSIASEVK